jgi:hypothetical protein
MMTMRMIEPGLEGMWAGVEILTTVLEEVTPEAGVGVGVGAEVKVLNVTKSTIKQMTAELTLVSR